MTQADTPAARYFFNARLVPMQKKDGGVRPIACGEVLRRTLGKIISSRVASKVGGILAGFGQVGVGIPSGIEAMYHAVSLFALNAEIDEAELAILKVDVKNAFNSIWRDAVYRDLMDEARKDPELRQLVLYMQAAYGKPTELHCGEAVLKSSQGMQQGDPLGPLFFAISFTLAVRKAFQKVEAVTGEAPPLNASFLDDLVVGGRLESMEMTIRALAIELAKIGLDLNLLKCELATNDSCALSDLSFWHKYNVKITPMNELSIVGAPAHSNCAEALIRPKLEQSKKKMDQFAALGVVNPHLAMLLGRFCGIGPKLAYWFRMCGTLCNRNLWEEAQGSISSFVTSIIGPIGDTAHKLLLLPPSMGGLGFHNFDEAHYIAASFASFPESSPLASRLSPWCKASVEASLVRWMTDAEEILGIDVSSLPPQRIQKHIGRQLNERNAQLVANAGVRASCVARLACNKLASQWVAPDFDQMQLALLPPASFVPYARFRLGEPLATDPLPCSCPTCDQVSDIFGDHALKCMRTGAKQKWHHALERAISSLASTALWRPDREPHPFPSAPSRRLDIALPIGTYVPDKMTLIDVTVTHDLDFSSVRPAGHAATRKAKEKQTVYGELICPATQLLLPLPFETLGGHTKDVASFLSRLSTAVATRHDAGRLHVPAVIASTITRAVADRLAAVFSRPVQIVEPFFAPQEMFSDDVYKAIPEAECSTSAQDVYCPSSVSAACFPISSPSSDDDVLQPDADVELLPAPLRETPWLDGVALPRGSAVPCM
jgi:hypothetical protein